MLCFVRGRVKSGKTTYIIEKIKNERRGGTILLVPEQYSHTMERRLCRLCGNSVSAFAEVTNFRRLATKVRAETGGLAVGCVGEGRRILLLHSAVKECAAKLDAFSGFSSSPELLQRLLQVIDEFKTYGISPEDIVRAAGSASDGLSRKLSDLGMIYAAYENFLSEDEEDEYDTLAAVAESLKRNSFFCKKTLYLDGFSGFTTAELDIIEAAISKADDVYITLATPRTSEKGAENGIFDKAFETMARLSARAERNGVKVQDIYLESHGEDAFSFLDTALYSPDNQEFSGDCSPITIARTDGIFEECELAAAYILESVREKNARWKDFHVAVASEEEYAAVAESVFSRYGIPVYVSKKDSLPDKPVISLISAAFECIMRRFKTDAVMEYLKTGFSGICRRSLDIFEDYLYVWSPRESEWGSEEGFTKNPFGITAENTDDSKARLDTVNRVRKKLYEPLEKLRSAIQKGKSGIKCAEALYDFISDINLSRRCDAYVYIAEQAGRLREAQEYEMLFGILCDAIDSIGRAVGSREISIDELSSLFKIVVSKYELATIPSSLDCVNISSVGYAGGIRAKYMIVMGAQDGKFPSASDNTGLLSDTDRDELLDLGVELAPSLYDRISEQFCEIHAAMCAAEKELYISSSAASGGTDTAEESPIVARLRKLFPRHSEGFTVHEARLCAKVPCFDENVSSGEALDFWRSDSEYAEKLRRAEHNSVLPRGPITKKENISAVFGKSIALSASRAELFSSCRFAYFMKYGMRVNARTRAKISPIEAGTLMHYVLEKTVSELARTNDYNVEKAKALASAACSEFVSERLQGAGKLSPRMEFMIKRLCRTVQNAVEDICRELSDSEFTPRDFELRFADGDGDLPAIRIDGGEMQITMRGAVDRIDTFEKDGNLYFRVIDYKSGRREFVLDESVNGIGMQLLIYMFALEEIGKQRYGVNPISAGAMYVRLTEALAKKRGGEVASSRREGVVLRDMGIINAMEKSEKKVYLPVSIDSKGGLSKKSSTLSARGFEAVKARMEGILRRIGDELSHGEVEANPYYTSDNRTACDYCEYISVCRFDDRFGEDMRRNLFEVRARDITDGAEV